MKLLTYIKKTVPFFWPTLYIYGVAGAARCCVLSARCANSLRGSRNKALTLFLLDSISHCKRCVGYDGSKLTLSGHLRLFCLADSLTFCRISYYQLFSFFGLFLFCCFRQKTCN